ncbi:MAG TPA: outer membrane protein assembly factor BamD [Fibrobacteria bacterium]|nr:outer membrane protein assembly factor BamD [Fibrobacteria bacterium]
MPFSADSAKPGVFPSGRKCSVLAIAALGAFSLLACSSGKKLTQEQSCQEKWDKAKPKFDKKKYVQAKELLSELVTSCPGSPFTEEALFDLGETHYGLKEWEEAEQEYASFLKEFPSSKKYGELAGYRSAEVAAKQVETPSRDQTKTLDAIAAYENFLDEYPDGPRADSAKAEVDKLRDLLVEKQMMIAKLYRRMGEPQAAAIYYKNLLKEFGGRVNQRDINLRLALCYIEMGQFDEADSYLGKFDGIAKDDPFKEKVKDAYRDLEKARIKLARQKKDEQEQGKRQEAM